MNTLVVGASGATGRLLVDQLLAQGHRVKAIVRAPAGLPKNLLDNPRLAVIHANLLDIGKAELAGHVEGCDAIASCLGHNMSFRGIFGHPRRLVTDATRRLCAAVKNVDRGKPTKFVLMNTVGNRNRDLDEPISFAQKCVIGLLRVLAPPHADNEEAADYLRTRVGRDDAAVQWVVVRPDSLIDKDTISEYELHASPTRSAIFNPGKTSRINVAHFMAKLMTDDQAWEEWKGQMPVIYNKAT